MEMGKAVEKALEEDILGEDGKEILKKLKDEKRFAKELWSE
jgi:sulfite reductase alpha subunit-like flavoprotein